MAENGTSFAPDRTLLHAVENPNRATVYVTLLIAFALLLFSYSRDGTQKLAPGIMVVGGSEKQTIRVNRERFRENAKEMLEEGYRKSDGGFFYVPSPLGERLMIPVKYLEELKTAPVEEVDFVATFIEQEIVDSFADLFPACEDWTPVPVVAILTQIVARVSSCMFGGTTLSHNKEWVKSSIDFAIDGFIGAQKIKKYPEFVKPLVARFIPEIRKIADHYAAAEAAAIPMLESRRRTGEKAMDLLYWMAEQAKDEEQDLKFLAGILLKVSFAAIHTSAAAPAQLLYDLCEHPEFIEPLREEVDNVIGHDGLIDKSGFMRMAKMDSFMKESQRFNPLLLITFERVIHKPLTLSSGFTIPAHTTIGIPTQAITMDESLYPSPVVFDPFRFSRMREERPEMDGRAQYVASNPASLSFGYGRHACPGRFFAAQEIKAIMAHILRNYDLRFSAGQSRPGSLRAETQYLPHPAATVEFKRRS
ncbi:hypothetical protein INS49_013260 [Diaporthe citri]|uniref:uncharacterized protein n=1 Tax=Diaporthe citri TaxID=83186 RepID=UPI001C7EE6DC|nr:uncharacterized protein INS49_013260 [Diaporthe citri]KAG6357383.1 hypothetical protein INS49_013260 [Diaporthe citri]